MRSTSTVQRLSNLARKNRMLSFLGLLCLLQVAVLSSIRTGTSYDGAEQLLYTQNLEWGYGRSQPPLYTWLLIGIQQLFGVNQFSENLLKFSLLFALFVLMWRIALRLGFKAATASTIAASPFLVIEIGWEVQRNYSHSVLLLALTAAFALCYLRVQAVRSTAGYVALGLIFGLMLLTKYNAVLFVLALVVADLIALRKGGVFRSWKAVAIPVIAAGLVTPHALWALDNANHVLALTHKFAIAAPGNGIAARAQGLLSFVIACASILAIPALMAGLHRGWTIAYPDPHGTKRVFVLWTTWAIAFGLVLVLVSGTTNVNVRWMLPLAIPALQILCGVVCDAEPRTDRHFKFLAITLAVLATAGQWIESWTDTRKGYDYGELMKVVAETTGASEFLINDYAVLANLRLYAPQVRVLNPVMPAAKSFPLNKPVMIWTGGNNRADEMLRFARALGACVAEPVPHAYTLNSRGHRHQLTVHYQALKTDCG
ncbi:glycosyltransferase family 39 protein [Mesorhizobium sp. ANAO-SY3R2]|uniref:glycosyltransferase family 39 protein n=1 Tax=Mesorhizobium sp. ANAO-SY3R2 TaxID=3166644 RepID=UPI00366F8660